MNLPLVKLGLASAIAVAAVSMTGCGGSNDSESASDINADGSVVDRFECIDSSTAGSRVICIGVADDLTDATVSSELVSALNNAQSGDTIVLPQGRFNMSTELTFNGDNSLGQSEMVEGLTIRGAGMDKTILDFTDSAAGADGFFITNTKDIVMEDFGVYEAPNNAVKLKSTDGIILRRVATVWETDYQSTNGAYGLYPVETTNVLIEDCYVKGSADAGVYVGQSSNIVVRNSTAEKNVAGIEIENSTNADVYGNTATGNTAGILVFDLPIGNGLYGSNVRVFNNIVVENNAVNFATDSGFAGGVHIAPPGTGMIILATSNVEIFDNTITDHRTTSIALSSYVLPDDKVLEAPSAGATNYGEIATYAPQYLDGWSPLVRSINIHDNAISNTDLIYAPEGSLIEEIILGYTYSGLKVPEILYDGLGEVMAQIPLGSGGLTDIATGINAIAAGLRTATAEPAEPALALDVAAFSSYAAGDYVCAANNGDITQSAVFPTNPANLTFDASGNPEPAFFQTDDSMTCAENSGKVAFIGTAAAATIAGVVYGCGEDDKTSEHCLPAAE